MDSGQESVVVEFPSANGSPACAPGAVVVVDVASGSVAYSMGLRAGDYLTAINGQPPISVDQIRSVLESTQESASVDILRAGTAYRLEFE